MKKMDADVVKLVDASLVRIPHHEQVFFFSLSVACILDSKDQQTNVTGIHDSQRDHMPVTLSMLPYIPDLSLPMFRAFILILLLCFYLPEIIRRVSILIGKFRC